MFLNLANSSTDIFGYRPQQTGMVGIAKYNEAGYRDFCYWHRWLDQKSCRMYLF